MRTKTEVSNMSCMLNESLTYAFKPNPGAKPTGRLANRPMRNVEMAEMAAVEVMRSCLIWPRQIAYSSLSVQSPSVGHTQVPPESERIEALTEI